jgi:hypothetical protein
MLATSLAPRGNRDQRSQDLDAGCARRAITAAVTQAHKNHAGGVIEACPEAPHHSSKARQN